MSHVLRRVGGLFAEIHRARMTVGIDSSAFDPNKYSSALVEQARRVWVDRLQSEFRSAQILTRFLTEVLGGGDPLDVYLGVVALIDDEVRHVALCHSLCEAIGATPQLPTPLELRDPPEFLRAPMPERALHTAISMLAINETISVAYISDLAARCEDPLIRSVLTATLADEDEHEGFGWAYLAQSIQRFPRSTLPQWQHLVQLVIEPHRRGAKEALRDVPVDRRRLDAFPDEDLVPLGLFSHQRQALVFEQVFRDSLAPQLRQHGLLVD